MVNHICWNPSFFPLPNADIHEISNFYQKRHLFIKNYSFFIKNLIDPPYKKLQPQISPFIKNSIFGNNRDPCLLQLFLPQVWALVQVYWSTSFTFYLLPGTCAGLVGIGSTLQSCKMAFQDPKSSTHTSSPCRPDMDRLIPGLSLYVSAEFARLSSYIWKYGIQTD